MNNLKFSLNCKFYFAKLGQTIIINNTIINIIIKTTQYRRTLQDKHMDKLGYLKL